MKMVKRFMMISVTMIAAALFFTMPVFAVPANPKPFTVMQPDGTKVTLSHRGDEYFDFYITDGNKLVIKDKEGCWRYLENDAAGIMALGTSAGDDVPETALDSSVFSDEKAKMEYASLRGSSYDPEGRREFTEPVTLSKLRNRDEKAGILSDEKEMKTLPLVTIVVSFNNIGYDKDHYWYDKLYGEDNSLKDYYSDMSNGKFTFVPVDETCSNNNIEGNENDEMDLEEGFDMENDGIIHVTIDLPHEDWSVLNPNEKTEEGKKQSERNWRMRNCMIEVLKKASPYLGEGGFARYDLNKNGEIEDDEMGISFIFAGFEASTSWNQYSEDERNSLNIQEDYLTWAHQGNIYGDDDDGDKGAIIDGVRISKYIVISDFLVNDRTEDYKKGNSEALAQESLGVIYHELGHYIGLPDLYDTDYTEEGEWKGYSVGDLSLMDGGSWSKDKEGNYCPAGLDAWSRVWLRWVDEDKVTESGKYTLYSQNSDKGYNTLYIPTDNDGEYYLLENRQPEGYDKALDDLGFEKESDMDKGGGIVIWHIDDNYFEKYKDDNTVNKITHHPAIMPLYAEYRLPWNGEDYQEFAMEFRSTSANSALPFYSKDNYSSYYSGADGFDDGLILPLYGTGDAADFRDGRTLSNISLLFPDNPAREMQVDIAFLENEEEKEEDTDIPISKIIDESEKKLLESNTVSSASKNSILKKADSAIDNEIMKNSLVSFNSALKGKGSSAKEYWVKVSMNSALRYDGRTHVLKDSAKASKSKNPDLYVEVLYCEKTGNFAEKAPSANAVATNGTDGWTKAEVKSAKLKNAKKATVGYDGTKLESVKGLSGSCYLSSLTLKDSELNKSLGKAVNQKLKELSGNIKKDKTSDYTSDDLDSVKATEEQQLLIPIYPAFIGVNDSGTNTYNTIDGYENKVEVTINPGSFDSAKNKLKGSEVTFKYDGGFSKKFALKFKNGKNMDFEGSVRDVTTADGKNKKQLVGTGNYFGTIDYE